MALCLEKYLKFTCISEHKKVFSLSYCEMVETSLPELGGKL